MEKTIKIDNDYVNIKATGGVLIRYKQQYGVDYNDDIQIIKALQLSETDGMEIFKTNLIVGSRLIWSMAKTADDSISTPEMFYAKHPSINIFSERFDFAVFSAVLKEANKLFADSISIYSDDNINEASGEPLTAENLIANCAICKMNTSDIDKLPIGMILNTIQNYCKLKFGESNDTKKATQADFDNF